MLLEQIRTLDKRRLKEKMGHLDGAVMNRVNSAIAVSFGLMGLPEDYDGGEVVAGSGMVASSAREGDGADKGLLG